MQMSSKEEMKEQNAVLHEPIQFFCDKVYSCTTSSIFYFSFFFQPTPPRLSHFVRTKRNTPETLEPIPYEFVV